MIALVTGGSSGVGKAICRLLDKNQYNVVNVDKSPHAKEGDSVEWKVACRSSSSIPSGYPRFEPCDVAAEPGKLADIIEYYKPPVLVNNVGILPLQGFMEQTVEDFDLIMNTNFRAAVFATQAALKYMLPTGRGHIVNVASACAMHADPNVPVYGATKAAVKHFTESIAGLFSWDGIRCNCVCPGYVNTKLCDDAEFVPSMLGAVPGGQILEPEDVAEVVLFILQTPGLNGAAILMDQGKMHGRHLTRKL